MLSDDEIGKLDMSPDTKINRKISNDVISNSYDNQFYSSIKLAKQVRDMQAQKSQLQINHHQDSPKIHNSIVVEKGNHLETDKRELVANRTPIENSRKSEMINAKMMSSFWRGAEN